MALLIGVDIGSNRHPTGICVAQEERRNLKAIAVEKANEALRDLLSAESCVRDRELSERIETLQKCEAQDEDTADIETHFLVRYLQPLAPGYTFPDIAERVGEIVAGATERTEDSTTVYVNATGKGTPIVDLLREKLRQRRVEPVFFTHGDRRTEERRQVTLGKAYLVARVQTLLQGGRLHLPRSAEAETLAKELRDYEVRVEPDANEHYGGFPVGSHDELVTALGLAVQVDPPHWDIF